ncbi:MAG: type III-A CRISPR-associated protein Csm2, partial [Mucispirillum sp.]|nr:type III-A CRISPR-associated protein Csm2 [Mucispirillum sp.]
MAYNDKSNFKPKKQEEIIKSYVFNEKTLPELIKDEAEIFAKSIKSNPKKQKDAYTQIRRFYDELVRIQTKSKDDNDSFDKYLPAVYIIASQAAYAQAKGNLSESFKEFIVN